MKYFRFSFLAFKLEELSSNVFNNFASHNIFFFFFKTDYENCSQDLDVNPDMEHFLEKVHSSIKSMNPDELTCSLLYLNKLGISLQHHTLQEIISECLFILNQEGKLIF